MKDYDSLYEKIKTIISIDNFKTKLMNGNKVKINVENVKTYRELTEMLNEDKLSWHTYENKPTRPYSSNGKKRTSYIHVSQRK